jgi:hypothetical protein
MNATRLRKRLLAALFVRAQSNETINLFELTESSAASAYAVLKELDALARAGLVDARRLRLTLNGLAVASTLRLPAARVAEEEPVAGKLNPVRGARHAA